MNFSEFKSTCEEYGFEGTVSGFQYSPTHVFVRQVWQRFPTRSVVVGAYSRKEMERMGEGRLVEDLLRITFEEVFNDH
jgi:hypothetical protein